MEFLFIMFIMGLLLGCFCTFMFFQYCMYEGEITGFNGTFKLVRKDRRK